MKLTIKEVIPKIILLKSIDVSDNDKLSYAVKKNLSLIDKEINEFQSKFNEELDDYKFELALVDEKGCFVLDEKGNNKFTADSLLKIRKKQRELTILLQDSEIEFEPFILTDKENRYATLDLFLIEELKDYL